MAMENENGVTDVVVLKQLPVIEERLAVLRDEINAKVSAALAMECTEESVKEIKKVRASLKKEATDFEEKRKDIKRKILEPYEAFEGVYKQYIGNLYKDADSELSSRINSVEDSLKERRLDDLMDYFDECVTACGLTFEDISFVDCGVNVTLSASMKSMKETIKTAVERVRNELAAIEKDPNADEVLVEYRKCKNLSMALLTVSERHREMEEIRRRAEQNAQVQEEEAAKVAEIDAIVSERQEEDQSNEDAFSAPVVEAVDEAPKQDAKDTDLYEVTFRVRGTLQQMIAMKTFLHMNKMEYEQI